MEFKLILVIGIVVLIIVLLMQGVRVVRQSECLIIERLGGYHTTLTSGLNFTIPFVDQVRPLYWSHNGVIFPSQKIDLRETVLDVPEQVVITRDNVSMKIDALLYIQITDPVRALYEIENLPTAVAQLAQTSLRNVIGELDLDHSLVSRDTINTKLKIILDEATDKWGTKVNRVELKNITPPREIQLAMEKQMQAERERRAKVLEAEGDKQARIARSEGMRQEQINLSEGERESQMRRATGEADAIRQVAQAKREAIEEVKKSLDNDPELTARYLVAYKYIEAFEAFVQKPGDKVFVPYESSTALGSIGGIADILKPSSQKSPSSLRAQNTKTPAGMPPMQS